MTEIHDRAIDINNTPTALWEMYRNAGTYADHAAFWRAYAELPRLDAKTREMRLHAARRFELLSERELSERRPAEHGEQAAAQHAPVFTAHHAEILRAARLASEGRVREHAQRDLEADAPAPAGTSGSAQTGAEREWCPPGGRAERQPDGSVKRYNAKGQLVGIGYPSRAHPARERTERANTNKVHVAPRPAKKA